MLTPTPVGAKSVLSMKSASFIHSLQSQVLLPKQLIRDEQNDDQAKHTNQPGKITEIPNTGSQNHSRQTYSESINQSINQSLHGYFAYKKLHIMSLMCTKSLSVDKRWSPPGTTSTLAWGMVAVTNALISSTGITSSNSPAII